MSTANKQTSMQALQISVEALRVQTKVTTATEGVVSDMLQSVFSRTRGAFNSLFDKPGLDPVLGVRAEYDREDSYKHLTGADFPLLARQPLDTMEGFIGKYVDYTPVVIKGLNYFEEHLDEALKFYRILVGSMINNRTSRAGWEDLTNRFEKAALYREAEDRNNAEFWAPGSHAAVQTVGSVISRISDLQQLDKDGETVKSCLRGYDLPKIKARTDEINDMIDILSKSIEKGQANDLSRNQITNLANGVMELAFQAEHFSVAVYRAHVYLQALKRLQAVVKSYH